MATSVFASNWKEAIVLPLIKKSNLDRNILKNYRPISNLSFISKLTEKAALSQLCPYFENNHLLPPYQNAYRKFHSTDTNILKMTNDILWNMERRKVTSLVTLDLTAAFDTVDHNILLSVFQRSFGINSHALQWCESYLRPRQFHVKIRNSVSQSRDLPFSVPQGSAAGPVFYTMYASTLQNVILGSDVNITGYADDHAIYNSFLASKDSGEEETLEKQQKCLLSVKDWMQQNRLKMNDEKTECMLVGHRSQLSKCKSTHILVDGTKVKMSDGIKYLGLWIDKEFTFKNHIINKSKVAALNLWNIRQLRKHLNNDSCKTLVQALVMSHLDYGNAIFADLPASTLKPAQRIQNIAAKVVLGRHKHESATEALRDLHWLPIRQRCKFKLLLQVYKSLHNQAPSYLRDLLVLHTPARITRSAVSNEMCLVVPYTERKTFAARSFSVAGPRYWNQLPNYIKMSESTEVFRKKLKTYLFKDYFTS